MFSGERGIPVWWVTYYRLKLEDLFSLQVQGLVPQNRNINPKMVKKLDGGGLRVIPICYARVSSSRTVGGGDRIRPENAGKSG